MEWFPKYTTPGHKRPVDYRGGGAVSAECPISRLDLATINAIAHIAQAEFLRSTMMSHGMGGGSGSVTLYGPDLSQWPSRMVEIMEIFMTESVMVDNRMNEIDHQESGKH